MADVAHEASGAASPKPGDIALQQASRPDSPDRGKLRVFISYSRDDLHFADQLDAALNAYGFECIIDRHGISGRRAHTAACCPLAMTQPRHRAWLRIFIVRSSLR